jgi:hypothetical protein
LTQRLFKSQLSAKQKSEPNVSFTILLIRVLMRLAFLLEPLIANFAQFFLNRQMKLWERRNFILNHTVRVERLARFYYKIDFHLVLTSNQLEKILSQLAKML